MLRHKNAIRLLIANGYDESLATQLPKLYIADFFDKEQEKLSEALDIFIDRVQRGEILPNEDNTVEFANIEKIEESDMNPRAVNGILYEFRSKVVTGFNRIVARKPLQDILLKNNMMIYKPELEAYVKDPVYYSKKIIDNPIEYEDLCIVRPDDKDDYSSFIRTNDLITLLQSKGIQEDSITVIWGRYGLGPRYPKAISNSGIYLDYNTVINLGHIIKSNQKK